MIEKPKGKFPFLRLYLQVLFKDMSISRTSYIQILDILDKEDKRHELVEECKKGC